MISAKIVADSISPQGNRLTTMEIVFPRYILAELNTHRMLSKNSASSRAIPFNKMVKSIQDSPFVPYAWQVDHKGMQGNEYFTEEQGLEHKYEWLRARNNAIDVAQNMNQVGNVTKQLANRLLEPFMYHKVLVSGTEFENFFNLRCPQYIIPNSKVFKDKTFKSRKDVLQALLNENMHTALKEANKLDTLGWLQTNKGQADIHMMFLAEAIYDAMNESTPRELKEGEWHIPYGDNFDEQALERLWLYDNNQENTIKVEAIEELKQKISIARCARLSYETLGDNPTIDYNKDLNLYNILLTNGHASPFEHVARVFTNAEYEQAVLRNSKGEVIKKGVSRNFIGFLQFREILNL